MLNSDHNQPVPLLHPITQNLQSFTKITTTSPSPCLLCKFTTESRCSTSSSTNQSISHKFHSLPPSKQSPINHPHHAQAVLSSNGQSKHHGLTNLLKPCSPKLSLPPHQAFTAASPLRHILPRAQQICLLLPRAPDQRSPSSPSPRPEPAPSLSVWERNCRK
jgi:hypothetical protein